MLTVLSAGLPVSARGMLSDAVNKAFDGAVDIQELNKDNLRSRVRLSLKNVEIVLVVLDGVSADTCADIENGLYSSDKYFTYTTDRDLADFLNKKYDLNIEVEEEEVCEVETSEYDEELIREYEDKIQEYEEKLKFKDEVISNLESRIKDLNNLYIGDEEIVIDSTEGLSSSLQDLQSELGVQETKVSELEGVVGDKEEELRVLKEKLERVSSNYESVIGELGELKVSYSKQSGVLHDKESKISELNGVIEKLEKDLEKTKDFEDMILKYRTEINSKERTISDLRVDLESKNRELARYAMEKEDSRSQEGKASELEKRVDDLKEELATISSENDDLKKKLNEADESVSALSNDSESSLERVKELEEENKKLRERIESDNESLSVLNKDKLELQSKLSLFEQAGKTEDELLLEIQTLRDRVAELSGNIFAKIGSSALPNASVGGKVLSGSGRFNNIRFAFAGSAESRKGTYKCLLDEFRRSRDDTKYLIVDLVSETSVDYVFEVKRLVPGIEWFRKGGSVQPYLSDTALRNTKVLSAGLGYINDSYFLCIDWGSRLVELDNSGYKVVLFCGDLSNVVGRVLHESFASYGDSVVYVVGNSIGSRTIVTNLRGLSNAKDSVVAYYDFNSDLQKFYNMVSKTNKCTVLSTRNVRR